MRNIPTKPKLIFFQFKYDDVAPEFQIIHKNDHIKCLSEFFNVIVINKDCDYKQICDEYQPDLVLFESGLEVRKAHKFKIVNINSYPQIPKVAFLNADACTENRAGILSDMEHWEIETFFSIAIGAGEHLHEISSNLFVWPNFIDDETYLDYGESKNIPVLLTGCLSARYPWRQEVFPVISMHYPSLICPHAGYDSRVRKGQMLYGERYARTINASLFVPTCGSVTKEVVRKHFEIPGCRSCLITERSPGLEAAGFVDMKNCVFADKSDVLDKLDYLFSHPDEFREIVNNGYNLVQSRHTIKKRDQIFQWFNLNKTLKPNQKIVQLNPFEPLVILDESSALQSFHIISDGLHLRFYQLGDEQFDMGCYEEAQRYYLKSLFYLGELPEPKLKLALCNLHLGNPKVALSWIIQPLQCTLAGYKAADPDPVEWAYFIICLLCLGKIKSAIKRTQQFPWLRHPELNRVRLAVSIITNDINLAPENRETDSKARHTIHNISTHSFNEWIDNLCTIFELCSQSAYSENLRRFLKAEQKGIASIKKSISHFREKTLITSKNDLHYFTLDIAHVVSRKKITLRGFDNPLLWDRVKIKMKDGVLGVLRKIEGSNKYFLPYKYSKIREDEFINAIEKLTSKADITTVLLIDRPIDKYIVEAIMTSFKNKLDTHLVFCIVSSDHRYISQETKYYDDSNIKIFKLSSTDPKEYIIELEEATKKIKKNYHIKTFDMILINTNGLDDLSICSDILKMELTRAKVLVFNGTNNLFYHNFYKKIRNDSNCRLVSANPALRNGYAIFVRKPN